MGSGWSSTIAPCGEPRFARLTALGSGGKPRREARPLGRGTEGMIGGKAMVRRTTAAACLLTACAMFALLSTSALATPGSLEFGKCAKTAGGKFKNAGCTKLAKTAEEQKFEWAPLGTTVAFTTAKKAETGEAVIGNGAGNQVSCSTESSTAGEFGAGRKEQKNH